MTTTKLSERARPGSECAPWVHAEIVKLESRVIDPDKLKRIQYVCEHVLSIGEHPLKTAAEMQGLIDVIDASLTGGYR